MTADNKISRFQQWLAPRLGDEGWRIIGVAANPDDPDYLQALSLCKKVARQNGKGWPHQWPARQAAE